MHPGALALRLRCVFVLPSFKQFPSAPQGLLQMYKVIRNLLMSVFIALSFGSARAARAATPVTISGTVTSTQGVIQPNAALTWTITNCATTTPTYNGSAQALSFVIT